MSPASLERLLAKQRKELIKIDNEGAAEIVDAWRELNKYLQEQLKLLLAEIEATPGPMNRAKLRRMLRYQRLLEDVERESLRFADKATKVIKDSQVRALSLVDAHTRDMTREAMGGKFIPEVAIATVESSFGRLPAQAFMQLVGNASDGKPLGDLLNKIAPKAKKEAADVLTRGIAQGHNPRKIARAFRRATGVSYTRAETISRTEVIRAYREATLETYRTSPVVTEWVWVAALDVRTCFACAQMSGTVHPMSESLNGHPRCFPSGTIVSGPRNTGSTSRWFDGDVVKIDLRSGNSLTSTPNHPILTTKGWVAAGLLHEGCNVISGGSDERIPTGIDPDDHQVPARIEDVAAATGSALGVTTRSVPTAPEDFHGDGAGSKVSVVRTNRLLRNGTDAALGKPKVQQLFARPDVGMLALASLSNLAALLEGLLGPPHSGMGSIGIAPILLGAACGHHQSVGIGAVSDTDASLAQDATDDTAAYPVPTSESILGLTGDVGTDEIVGIRKVNFAGMVHNLETPSGWYIANGIVVHNCRCSMAPKTKTWEELGFKGIPDTNPKFPSGKDWFNNLSDAQQRQMLGPGKLDALKSGAVSAKDLVATPHNRTWGPMVRNSSLKEARAAAKKR